MLAFKKQVQATQKTLLKKTEHLNNRGKQPITFNASILGIYGWHVSIPVLLGIILGRYLDNRFPVAHISWTLNFIILGVLIGFYHANRWVQKAWKVKVFKKDKSCKK